MTNISKKLKREADARVLAVQLDEFFYDYDYYGYMDALKDTVTDPESLAIARVHNIEDIEKQLLENDTCGLENTLSNIADEELEEISNIALELLDKISKNFPDPVNLTTNEEWSNFLSKRIKLNYYDSEDLIHDLNNLRANEWIEVLIDKDIGAHILNSFKEFFNIEKEENIER